PAEHALHALQQRLDAALAAIGDGAVAVEIKGELLVLRADPPLLFGLVALRQVRDELVHAFDRPGIGGVARHSVSSKLFGRSFRRRASVERIILPRSSEKS